MKGSFINKKTDLLQEDLAIANSATINNQNQSTTGQDDDFDIQDFDHNPFLGIDQSLLS